MNKIKAFYKVFHNFSIMMLLMLCISIYYVTFLIMAIVYGLPKCLIGCVLHNEHSSVEDRVNAVMNIHRLNGEWLESFLKNNWI